MQEYVPLKRESHASAGYAAQPHYQFATEMSLVPVLKAELASVIGHMCLAFRRIENEQNRFYDLVAIQSLKPKKNLYVLPDGRWIRGYRPAFYRAHPFALLPSEDLELKNQVSEKPEPGNQVQGQNRTAQHKYVLSVKSDLVKQKPSANDLRFYDEEGQLTEKMQAMLKFLGETLKARHETLASIRSLEACGLIVPWPIEFSSYDLQTEKQQKYSIDGLYRIDDQALKALIIKKLHKLNQADALMLAHAQILSEARLQELASRETAFQKLELKLGTSLEHKEAETTDLEDLFGDNDDLLTF